MAAIDRYDSSECHEPDPGGAEQDSRHLVGLVLIGMICGTTAAITAFLHGASLWTMLLAYVLVGWVTGLLVLAIWAIRFTLTGQCTRAANRPPYRRKG
ncbi:MULTISPECIES: hypothetical protein [unclassified Roseovarius]|uniref:hypothetical protein n=1 Tax=unclassified Roseovarius TaxID=2614913 RepID=UPI00273FD424|nr:hypothetical protein [Roseovarius sp. MMSF_3350]